MYRKKQKFLVLVVIIVILLFLIKKRQTNEEIIGNELQSKSQATNYVTIIAMYFHLPRNKRHNESDYGVWLNTFMQSVGSPLVMFCDRRSLNKLKILSEKFSVNTKFYVYENIWDLMRRLESYRNMSYVDNYWNYQYDLDPDKNRYIHHPNLYAVWGLKPFIAKLASDYNSFNSEYFVYVDSGSWRYGIFKEWPYVDFMKQLAKIQRNRILIGQVGDNLSDLVRKSIIQGAVFSGTKQAIDTFYNNYYTIHDKRIKDGLFAAREEVIMNFIAYKEYNNTVLKFQTSKFNKCKNVRRQWFFFQHFYANNNYFNCSLTRLSFLF